jgi:hypothetical protein
MIYAPAGIMLVLAIVLAPRIGGIAFGLPLLSVPFCYAINMWQFPYTNGFELWQPRCSKCGYDMRSSVGNCPECGGAPEAAPNHRLHLTGDAREGE